MTENTPTVDEFGTDVASLVPIDLAPEPEDHDVTGDHDGDETVTAPAADLSGDPVQPDSDALAGLEFDDAADLAILRQMGDRARD